MQRHDAGRGGLKLPTNRGDLSWTPLEAIGSLTVFDRTPDAVIVARAADAEALIANNTILSAATIAGLPKLASIGLLSTGVNLVDLAAARATWAKREVLPRELAKAGLPEAAIALIRCPLGLAIGGNQPGEIAVSVTAEILQERGRHRHCPDDRGESSLRDRDP